MNKQKALEISHALHAASAPSREIDGIIAVAVDWKFDDHEEGDQTPREIAEKYGIEWLVDRMENGNSSMWRSIPKFTQSIDDSTSLMKDLIRCEFGTYGDGQGSWAYVNFRQDGQEHYGNSKGLHNHPMAILSAFFSALAE